MQIKLLKASDAPQYRTLMLEAYTLAADAFTSTAEERAAEPESFWVNRIAGARGQSAAFGAFVGQDLVGTVALEFAAKCYAPRKLRFPNPRSCRLSFLIDPLPIGKCKLSMVSGTVCGND